MFLEIIAICDFKSCCGLVKDYFWLGSLSTSASDTFRKLRSSVCKLPSDG